MEGVGAPARSGIEQLHAKLCLLKHLLKCLQCQPYSALALFGPSSCGDLNPSSHVLVCLSNGSVRPSREVLGGLVGDHRHEAGDDSC